MPDLYAKYVKDTIFERLQNDPVMEKLKEELRSSTFSTQLKDDLASYKLLMASGDPETVKQGEVAENERVISYIGSHPQYAAAKKFESRLHELTGLHPYSFFRPREKEAYFSAKGAVSDIDTFPEISSTYAEGNPIELRKNPEIAQLLYDRANSLNLKEDDPGYWMVEEAAQRCRIATGSACNPCVLYTATCSTVK